MVPTCELGPSLSQATFGPHVLVNYNQPVGGRRKVNTASSWDLSMIDELCSSRDVAPKAIPNLGSKPHLSIVSHRKQHMKAYMKAKQSTQPHKDPHRRSHWRQRVCHSNSDILELVCWLKLISTSQLTVLDAGTNFNCVFRFYRMFGFGLGLLCNMGVQAS